MVFLKTVVMQRVAKHLARFVASVRDYCITRDASLRALHDDRILVSYISKKAVSGELATASCAIGAASRAS
jgi:hypothetical protein